MSLKNPLLAQARTLYRQGRLDESEAVYLKLSTQPDTVAEGTSGIALISLTRGDAAAAAQLFAIALDHDANNADAHYGLGLLAQRQDALADAVGHFRLATRSNPGHVDANRRLAQVTGELKTRQSNSSKSLRVSAKARGRPTDKASLARLEVVEKSKRQPKSVRARTDKLRESPRTAQPSHDDESEHDFYAMLRNDKNPSTVALSKKLLALMDRIERPATAPKFLNATSMVLSAGFIVVLLLKSIAAISFLSISSHLMFGVDPTSPYPIAGPTIIISLLAAIFILWRIQDLRRTRVGIHHGRLSLIGGFGRTKTAAFDLWLSQTVSVKQRLFQMRTGDGILEVHFVNKQSIEVVGLGTATELREIAIHIRNFELSARTHPAIPRGIFA